MAKEWAKGFYSSKAWKKCRAAYWKHARGLCEICLAKGIYKAGAIVHHKVYLTQENIYNPAVSLNFDNLQLVCRECHEAIHKGLAERRYEITPDGRVHCPPIDE